MISGDGGSASLNPQWHQVGLHQIRNRLLAISARPSFPASAHRPSSLLCRWHAAASPSGGATIVLHDRWLPGCIYTVVHTGGWRYGGILRIPATLGESTPAVRRDESYPPGEVGGCRFPP